MEMLYFAGVAIITYFASGWILNRIEQKLGHRIKQRQVVFFAILLVLAMSAFYLVNTYLQP